MSARPELILALDVDTFEKAKSLVDALYPKIKTFKVGLQLFTACGPDVVKMIIKKGAGVFLDLKFHDIPNTVSQAVASTAGLNIGAAGSLGPGAAQQIISPGVFMMTVHTMGGRKMLEEAAKGVTKKANELKIKRPFIVGVTRLTSDENTKDIPRIVLEAARLAKDSGLDGVVCAVPEAAAVRKECGENFIIVTPGIRADDAPGDDQKRTATVEKAIASGSNFLVIGRPILEAKNPIDAAEHFLKNIDGYT